MSYGSAIGRRRGQRLGEDGGAENRRCGEDMGGSLDDFHVEDAFYVGLPSSVVIAALGLCRRIGRDEAVQNRWAVP
jgi:hypothetical protein